MKKMFTSKPRGIFPGSRSTMFLLLLAVVLAESTYVPRLTSSAYNFYRKPRTSFHHHSHSSFSMEPPSLLPTTLSFNGNSDYPQYESSRYQLIQLPNSYRSYSQNQNLYQSVQMNDGPSSRFQQQQQQQSSPHSQTTYYATASYPTTTFLTAPASWSQRPPYYPSSIYITPMLPSTFAKRLDQPQQIVGSTSFSSLSPAPAPSSSALLSSDSSQAHTQTHNIASEHYPVYVLPPKNFQPIIYHQSGLPSYITRFGMPNTAAVFYQSQDHHKPSEESWYESGNREDLSTLPKLVKPGLASLSPNKIFYEPEDSKKTQPPIKPKVVYITASDNFSDFPVLEASTTKIKRQPEKKTKKTPESKEPETTSGSKKSIAFHNKGGATNPYNSFVSKAKKDVNKNVVQSTAKTAQKNQPTKRSKTNNKTKKVIPKYRTKLPVGMSSFFLGGVRGVSGRHWNLPSDLVKKIEFMPNIGPIGGEEEEKYYPELEQPVVVGSENDGTEKEETVQPDTGTESTSVGEVNSINNHPEEEKESKPTSSVRAKSPSTPSSGSRLSPLKLSASSSGQS